MQQFNLLAQAVRNRNEQALSQLTEENPERLKLFTRLFETYLEIDARVESVDHSLSANSAIAVLKLDSMLLPNGNRAFPSQEYNEISLKIVKLENTLTTDAATAGAFGRIQW